LATLPAFSALSGSLSGWRGLGRFWIAVVALVACAALALQVFGPPRPAVLAGRPDSAAAKAHEAAASRTHATAAAVPPRPGNDATSGTVNDPDASLLQPAPGLPNALLPRISADGGMPMRRYAAPFDPNNLHPRVGLLIAGIGMNEADSLAAITTLPGGVTLAVSPYASGADRILAAARQAAHEYVLEIPMEPQGYPLSDPDDRRALMTSIAPAENLPRLTWILSRFAGYVGVTNAFGALRGERLSGQPDQMESVLDDISRRGLLFVDARPGKGRLPLAWNRPVDLLIDDDASDAAALDSRLDELSHMALDKGSALGLVSLPRPKTLERVAAWTNTLVSRGLALAPVSALVMPPVTEEQEK
jgi:polysaccharide deacetylase 2 family uncharacterized protein YibQ